MRRSRFLAVFLVVGIAVAARAPSALAVAAPTADCYSHNRLTRHFTVHQLEQAINTMPAMYREYASQCLTILQDQLDRQLGKSIPGTHPTSGSGGGSSGTTILIIVVIVVVLGGGGLALLAARRQRSGGDGQPPEPTRPES